MHWKAQAEWAVRSDQGHTVSKALLHVMLMDAYLHPGALGPMEPCQRRERRRRQEARGLTHWTAFIIRSQRILDSPCWAAFCLLNHTNEALPTK